METTNQPTLTQTGRDWIKAEARRMNPIEHVTTDATRGYAPGDVVRMDAAALAQFRPAPEEIDHFFTHPDTGLAMDFFDRSLRRLIRQGEALRIESLDEPSGLAFCERLEPSTGQPDGARYLIAMDMVHATVPDQGGKEAA